MRRIPHEDFIRSWQTSATAQEVADELGITVSAAYCRARYLRLRGVALKRMGAGRKPDFTRLNALALSLTGQKIIVDDAK